MKTEGSEFCTTPLGHLPQASPLRWGWVLSGLMKKPLWAAGFGSSITNSCSLHPVLQRMDGSILMTSMQDIETGGGFPFIQNILGQVKTSCTITTQSKGNLYRARFLKCHSTESNRHLCPLSVTEKKKKKMWLAKPSRRAKVFSFK